jgi:flagellar protein FlaF
MAGGIIIASAIGILLLLLVGYVIVGSTLTSYEIVASAQKDLTLMNEERLNTKMTGSGKINRDNQKVEFEILNDGSKIISDFSHMDIFVSTNVAPSPARYTYGVDASTTTWKKMEIKDDFIHPGMLDPGETMKIQFTLLSDSASAYVTVVSGTGSIVSKTIT